jgi:hypothetical protein
MDAYATPFLLYALWNDGKMSATKVVLLSCCTGSNIWNKELIVNYTCSECHGG